MKAIVLFMILVLPSSMFSQALNIKKNRGGIISVGMRTPVSVFNDGHWNDLGTGVGGQFRIQLAKRVNTDWFFDYLTGNVGSFAHRTDYHIGWSVLYYLRDYETTPQRIQPYILAGHCFDYSLQEDNRNTHNFAERWSSAVQAGVGTHFNLTERFDASLTAQYMIHLGTDIDADYQNNQVVFTKHHGVNLEGHILINLSLNYKLIDAW